MVHGALEFKEVTCDSDIDHKFKPGLFCQTMSFTTGQQENLCSLEEAYRRMRLYEQIAGYADTK